MYSFIYLKVRLMYLSTERVWNLSKTSREVNEFDSNRNKI